MWVERCAVWKCAQLFLLFILIFFPSTVLGKTDSWSQTMLRAGAYQNAGDCDAQWRLLWDFREETGSYSYLVLTGMAIFGVHPEHSIKHKDDKKLAFQFAVMSGLKGQILNLEQMEEEISGDKEDSMAFAMGLAREILLQASMEENGRYYSPMFQSCQKQSDIKYCVEEYVFEKKIDSFTFIQQLDEKLTHPDTRIECTSVDFK